MPAFKNRFSQEKKKQAIGDSIEKCQKDMFRVRNDVVDDFVSDIKFFQIWKKIINCRKRIFYKNDILFLNSRGEDTGRMADEKKSGS